MTELRFQGTGVALATPFDAHGQIDYVGLEKLIQHTASDVDYYVVMGTTGESVTTSPKEQDEVLKFVVAHNPRKLPVIFGIGGNNTAHVVELLKSHNLKGAEGILSVCPYYNKPSQEGLAGHFETLADASPLPIIMYNIPGRTGTNMKAETTLRLAAHKNIIGVKEASGNIEQCIRIAKDAPEGFHLISGEDLLTLPLLSIGAAGVISVLSNAFPGIFKAMITNFRQGNIQDAAQQAQKLVGINSLMYEEGSPTGLKQLLEEMGICKNFVRLPMTVASDNLTKRIQLELGRIK